MIELILLMKVCHVGKDVILIGTGTSVHEAAIDAVETSRSRVGLTILLSSALRNQA